MHSSKECINEEKSEFISLRILLNLIARALFVLKTAVSYFQLYI